MTNLRILVDGNTFNEKKYQTKKNRVVKFGQFLIDVQLCTSSATHEHYLYLRSKEAQQVYQGC